MKSIKMFFVRKREAKIQKLKLDIELNEKEIRRLTTSLSMESNNKDRNINFLDNLERDIRNLNEINKKMRLRIEILEKKNRLANQNLR